MNAGDLVFVRSGGFVARAIRLAQWLPWRAGARWNHVAILDEKVDGEWTVVQATPRGVTKGALLSALGEHEIMLLPAQLTRATVLAFARAQVGTPYGFLTIASIVATILTPRFVRLRLAVGDQGTWICSALGAESWRFAGWYHPWPDIYQVSPAELWIALTEGLTPVYPCSTLES